MRAPAREPWPPPRLRPSSPAPARRSGEHRGPAFRRARSTARSTAQSATSPPPPTKGPSAHPRLSIKTPLRIGAPPHKRAPYAPMRPLLEAALRIHPQAGPFTPMHPLLGAPALAHPKAGPAVPPRPLLGARALAHLKAGLAVPPRPLLGARALAHPKAGPAKAFGGRTQHGAWDAGGGDPWRARRPLSYARATVPVRRAMSSKPRRGRARPWGGTRRPRGTHGAAPGPPSPSLPRPRPPSRSQPRPRIEASPAPLESKPAPPLSTRSQPRPSASKPAPPLSSRSEPRPRARVTSAAPACRAPRPRSARSCGTY